MFMCVWSLCIRSVFWALNSSSAWVLLICSLGSQVFESGSSYPRYLTRYCMCWWRTRVSSICLIRYLGSLSTLIGGGGLGCCLGSGCLVETGISNDV
jgi:hypothetical protein